jgi:hypothetical protein
MRAAVIFVQFILIEKATCMHVGNLPAHYDIIVLIAYFEIQNDVSPKPLIRLVIHFYR